MSAQHGAAVPRRPAQPGEQCWSPATVRSSSSAVLDVPRTNRATIGDRAFNISAARTWNSLTTAVQSSESLGTFRRRLKAELFTRSYS